MQTTTLPSILHKTYLHHLEQGKFVSPISTDMQTYLRQNIRLFHITELMYETKKEKIEELLNLYGTLTEQGVGLLFVLHSDGVTVELSIGIKKYLEDANVIFSANVLQASFVGQYPGSQIATIRNSQVEEMQHKIFDRVQGVAAITGIPSMKTDADKEFVQGIDRFIDAMRGHAYTAMIIADPISSQEIDITRQGYAELSTYLSELSEIQQQVTLNESTSASVSLQEGMSQAISQAVGKTQSSTSTTTYGTSKKSTGAAIVQGIGGLAGGVAALGLAAATGGLAVPLLGLGVVGGGVVAAGASAISSAMGTTNQSNTEGSSSSLSQTTTHSQTTSHNTTNTNSTTAGTSLGRTYTRKDRNIQYHLDRNERYLERIQQGQRYGFWNTGMYFLAETTEVAAIAGSIFQGLFKGEYSDLEPSVVTHWSKNKHTDFEMLIGSLKKFQNPAMKASTVVGDISTQCGLVELLPTSMLTTQDLTLVMGLPERSAAGLPVRIMSRFGRQVCYLGGDAIREKIKLGNIYHLGRTEQQDLQIDLQSLTQHCLITGTTGAGKSNVSVMLLKQLHQHKIPFLVIEPSKGEYKSLSSWGTSIRCFSIGNPKEALLKLNPFQFPESTHVLEHIDRLGQLFSASFPMYAAMPSIVDEALHQVYEQAGWDLSSSSIREKIAFPTMREFVDLLPKIIDVSNYSEQMKSDYQGALVTRFKSLTRGIRGLSLCPPDRTDISNEELFDQTCIIDLKAVGSGETKAFFMGLILLRLFEYRNHQGLHKKLKHVTLIEEAHNLLRRTNLEQSQEGANPRGLAVEMFINAIAEMRAYGQGFTIVDQSPTSLDLNVIKNTNTKITLRTPYFEDRQLVGLSSNMTEEQMTELGRLQTGVIAVYQNDWIESVLCKVPYISISNVPRPNDNISIMGEEFLRLLVIPFCVDKDVKSIPDIDVTLKKCQKSFSTKVYSRIEALYSDSDVLSNYVDLCLEFPLMEQPLSPHHAPWALWGYVISSYAIGIQFARDVISDILHIPPSVVTERLSKFVLK